MSRYIAFTFGTAEQALEARGVLRDLENRNELGLYDAIVLAKNDAGHTKRQRDRSGAPIIGAMAGAMVGLLLVFVFTPFGVLLGAGIGALLAALLFDQRIEEDYIAGVEKHLRPGTSALLLLVSSGDVAVLGSSLRPFHLRVYESSLPPQLHATLRWAIR